MGLAVKKAVSRRRTPLPLLTPEYLQGISTFTLRYFENLFSRFKAPYTFVFDNYHSVPPDSNFHSMISDGLSTVPDGMNVIIISRHDIPPALSRLHANTRMGMLGWDELRLTLEESSGIVRLRKKGKTPKEMIRRLHDATDGWVAGLVLMLESLKRGIEPYLVGRLTQREIADYFGNEFFNKTDKKIQDFLLKTAFLPRITGKMAEKLTGLPNADNILSALNRNNHFTEALHSAEPLYQYHPLMREFLMTRAKETFSHETLSTLLHQAAILLEEDGQMEVAIELFRALDDWDAMVRLIMMQAPSMLEQGRNRPLGEWLGSLPGDLVKKDPWLLYWKGASQFPFDLHLSESYFNQAFEQFRGQGNLTGSLLAWSGVVETIFYSVHDVSKLDKWIEKFPELPENPEAFIPSEVWIRVVSSMFTALTNRHPDHPQTKEWTERAASIVQGPGSSISKAGILFHLIHWYVVIGDYENSSNTLRSFQNPAEYMRSLPFVFILIKLAEAMHYQLTGDHEKCLMAVSEGLKASESTGIFSLYCSLIGHAISSCQNVGDLDMADAFLQKMASSSHTLVDKGHYHFCQTRQFLLQSKLGAATSHAELCLKTALQAGVYSSLGVAYLVAAQVMHNIGKYKEAWNHLHEASRLREWSRSKVWEYSGLMIEAHFYLEQGDDASGLISLQKALAIGKERGYLNTYVDQPVVTARLCIKALEENIEVPYVQEIIRKRRLIPERPPLHLDTWPWPIKIHTFGRFELLKDGQSVQFERKIQKKPLSMLKAMIAFGGKEVREDHIMDALWPEADGDMAQQSFATNLHRLRQLLGYEGVIQRQEGKLTLNDRFCWVDTWAFEAITEQADVLLKKRKPEGAFQLVEKAIGIYKGPFLANEIDQPWTVSMAERLRNKFLGNVEKLGQYCQESGQWEKALDCYLSGLEVDDLAEEFYSGLMTCYHRLDRKTDVLAVYHRYQKTLSSLTGFEPSAKIEALYKSLIAH